MTFTDRALCASFLATGLILATCAGPAGSGSESAATQTTVVADSGPEQELGNDQPVEGDPVVSEPFALGSSERDVELSPLAAQVAPLPSAFPEQVLEGLGDPIGVQPLTVSIPDLGVDHAAIRPVGLEANGELEVPGADEVGWYQFGAGVDGGRGSTVLAAHIAFDGVDGVFRNLADSEVGEIVTVDGLDYRIETVTQYDKWELPIEELFAEDVDEQLVLITCGGSFNPDIRSFDDNVVVVAIPVDAEQSA